MIEDARTNDQLTETDFGKRLLKQITPERLQEFEAKAATKNKPHWGLTALKLIAAGGKLTIGGGLAAVNISAGVFALVTSAVPTLGLGTVPAAVAIAGSTVTGLNSGCDALRDIATALEK
jgi:hypothetical protein